MSLLTIAPMEHMQVSDLQEHKETTEIRTQTQYKRREERKLSYVKEQLTGPSNLPKRITDKMMIKKNKIRRPMRKSVTVFHSD